MPRPRAVLLLVFALASPGAAQTASTVSWVLASADTTVYGHTNYIPTLTLVPRTVYDSVRGVDSARVVDSIRVAAASAGAFAAGLVGWPTDAYCGGLASGAMQALEPAWALGRVRLAARCGVRIVLVAPRRLLTVDGRTNGVFSVDSAKRVTDRYAAVLPPDTLRKYRATLLGFNLADDYRCASCWGGRAITQAQIAAWAAYARKRLPGLPLGVRVTPDWVGVYPALAPLLDYAWAQYDTRKGDPQAFYDRAAGIAAPLGLRVVMGVNVEDCYGAGTSACPAAELVRYGTVAASHPASCAFLSWRYEDATWAQPEIREAWAGLLAAARARPGRDCRRVEGGV